MQIVRCGGFLTKTGITDIYGVYETGDAFIIESALGGAVQLSNITLEEPEYVKDEAITRICSEGNYDGIIMTATHLIKLKDNKATFSKFGSFGTDTFVTEFDTDIDFDTTEYEDDLNAIGVY